MSATNHTSRPARRRFLKGVMAVGGTTVLVAVGREAMVQDEVQQAASQPEQPAQPDGAYHVTSHIESYYEKARF